jgi:hypothetical protein
MDKDLVDSVKEKLNRNISRDVTLTRVVRKDIQVLGTITVSKGHTTFSEFSLVKVDRCFVILHHYKGQLPLSKDWNMIGDKGSGRDFVWVKLKCSVHTKVIQEALDMWKKYNSSSLMGYTFLIAYCLANGMDLVELGYID